MVSVSSVCLKRKLHFVSAVQLSAKAQELTLESDRYQITYHRYGVNIRESSIITLEHYFALRSLLATMRGNVSSERYARRLDR